MEDIYSSKESAYLEKTGTWHTEDSPWKAQQILTMLNKNKLSPKSIVEVGCGAGEILHSIDDQLKNPAIMYEGYDIAKDAIEMADIKNKSNFTFFNKDFTSENKKKFDLLLMIDVFEHVPDYIGFIEKCNTHSEYKIFHIPLDIHISSVLRGRMIEARKSVGHIHYFTKDTALATLKDSGLEIIDHFYTDRTSFPKSIKSKISKIFRKTMFPLAPDFTVKLLGGYSLLVLAK